MADSTPKSMPAIEPDHTKAFGHTYWMLNAIEAFERLAYFGIRAVVPIYIMQATEPGGLHMTAMHKGIIYAWWAIFQSGLPMFTGGVADRYGYKRVLGWAITANVIGYLMMAFMHSYYGFFAGILMLATGTAFFKPALQGSIAQNLTKENSSMGWGIFYWVVNVGAVCAPLLATIILGQPHSAEGWRNLFLASAIYTAVNLLLLLTFKDVPSGADKTTGVVKVFWVTVENIWPYWFTGGKIDQSRTTPGVVLTLFGLVVLIWSPFSVLGDWQWAIGGASLCIGLWFATWLRGGVFTWQLRLPAFLLIMSCFWMMMYQVWDLHPNFIEDWIDSSSAAKYVPFESWREYGDRGLVRVPQQILLTLNAFLIVLFVVPISWLVRKMRTLAAMLIGMSVATIGTLVAGLTGNGWILLLGITFFSLGEMLTGPKKNQYLGLIAPPGKKGLYLGYVNIPIGVGVGLGSLIAGIVYDNYGEKATLALKHMAANTQLVAQATRSVDWSDSLEKIAPLLDIDRSDAFALATEHLGQDEAQAAMTLRDAFHYDQGQIANLALLYLATHPEFKDEASKKLADALQEKGLTLDAKRLARYVDLLPDALGRKRVVTFDLACDRLRQEPSFDDTSGEALIVDTLWERFGGDPEVLNNLALEYLAQNTDRMVAGVSAMAFEHPPEEVKARIKEIEDRIGIGRTKSFAALAAATGASDADVEAALSSMTVSSDDPNDRFFAHLLTRHNHHRFIAVARKDWMKDVAFLQNLVSTDGNVLTIVKAEIDKQSFFGRIGSSIKRVLSGDTEADDLIAGGVNYTKLAYNPDLIQKALNAKDWAAVPDQGARLLALNPYEARALVAAEVAGAPSAMTRLLWDEYFPQYKVWIPFATIGVLAAIALAIFGQMAKRWTDMNA